MASADPRIDSYIEGRAAFARPIVDHLRAAVHRACPEVEETIRWSMPSFSYKGQILCQMAAFKDHLSFGCWRSDEVTGPDTKDDAMGQFGRLTSLDDLPPDAEFDALIREGAELAKSAPTPRKVKHEPKPAPMLHPEFAAALKANPKAKEMLDSFPPSAQRDYLEWISEAKQDATRTKRIATAVEWLIEGKRRHWKYQNC